MAAGAEGLNSEHTALKPFTYPMPETRFFHVDAYVYKFKIKYGNTININIDLHENIVSEELEEAIHVILGNLDNLRPFTTEHLLIFPYLNKWERISDLRFRHGDAFLIPYPYVCTLYIELNSSVFLGEEEYKDTCDSNHPEEIQHLHCGTASSSYDNMNMWERVRYIRTENAENSQQEGEVAILAKRAEEAAELKTRGFLELLKSAVFPPLLQRLFSGSTELS